jgi:glycerophosphoryl diester phosphodiesterase
MSFLRLFTFLSGLFFMTTATAHAIEIYAHRGASSLLTEGTIPSYQAAILMGADSIDMDIALTKDNIIVVNHDQRLSEELTRDANGKWLAKPGPFIRDITVKELQSYDVGSLNPSSKLFKKYTELQPLNNVPTPTLQEVIRMANRLSNNKIRFQIEIKTTPKDEPGFATPAEIVPPLLKVLREEKVLDRTEIHSFDWRNLMLIKELEPKAHLSFLTQQEVVYNNVNPLVGARWTAGHNVEDYDHSTPKMIAALGGKVWCPIYTDLTPALVEEAHRHHLKVVPWTVDTVEDMRRMIAFGVDGIITNYPQTLIWVKAVNQAKL